MKDSFNLYHGNCLEHLRTFPDASIDSIVTDPPYGLSFMGKRWDYDVPSVEVWAECLRVLKPGGHLLSFGGSRTYHRLACAVEDAGFEIRDQIMWVYGSGFPKSRNLDGDWQGWGTALKPAHEPIVVARKPMIGTVADNVLAHGTGAINVDGCRVGTETRTNASKPRADRNGFVDGFVGGTQSQTHDHGRWPANLIHDGSDEVLAGFPQAKGQQGALTGKEPSGKTSNTFGEFAGRTPSDPRGDTGSAARFFYCAKASRKDRHEGLEDPGRQFKHGVTMRKVENTKTKGNNHPTVKPTDLMRYLCRLVNPPGGVVLDPFMGSGSTGKAAMLEGFRFIGIEQEHEYLEIARARINFALKNLNRFAA